jgi:hypothetical protein
MKKDFVRLELLQNMFAGEADYDAWVANVIGSVGTAGYSFATDDEGCTDTEAFACDEMEFADVDVYDFMGSEYESERFYARDIVTFKHKATGEYYVLDAENLQEF